MMYLSLVSDDDGILATAEVDDEVWSAHKSAILSAADKAMGYSVQAEVSREGLHPSVACHSLEDVLVWIDDAAGWSS